MIDLTECRISIVEMSSDRSIRHMKVSHIEDTASTSQPNVNRSKLTLNKSSRSDIGAINMLRIVEGPIRIAAAPTIKK